MIGFETDLQDLRDSARALQDAADAAEAASTGLRGTDVPVSPGGGSGLFGGIAGMLRGDNAFGRSLGMRAVAKAFDDSNENVRKMQDEISGIYREFSDADIDHESTSGLQSLIMKHDAVWKALQRDSKPKLDDARQFLDVWRGSAANAVKAYLNQLA